jgi:NAD(P)-dependent dehydrogenase (short-subunit alcohol dehydrogenase family)
MAGRGGGSLLFVTTLHDEKPNGSDMAHSVAAGMIQNLVMEAALEYGEAGIRANQIAAGALEGSAERFPSDFATFYEGYRYKVPLGRLGTVEDVADMAVFLSSVRAGFINGARIRIDGGLSLHYLDQKANYRAVRALNGGL